MNIIITDRIIPFDHSSTTFIYIICEPIVDTLINYLLDSYFSTENPLKIKMTTPFLKQNISNECLQVSKVKL